LELDFVNDVVDGEELSSAAWEMSVRQGDDPSPMTHLIGDPEMFVPEGSNMQTGTRQRVSGLLPFVVYTVRALAMTTLGNTKSLWSHIAGEPVE
jgi:hypothetical protein